MQHLLRDSISVYSKIREVFAHSIENCREIDAEYARFTGAQMHYYASRCQSVNILLQQNKLWDSDIVMRSALECATRFLFVSIASQPERGERIIECTVFLKEIEDIQRADKARTAGRNSINADSAMLFNGAALDADREAELRSRWPKTKRQILNQKWSFSQMVRVLEKVKEPTLDLTSYDSLLHSYGISSHLIHADQTAMDFMYDRVTREPEERCLMERAHFARLAVQQTTLLFLCWRALEHATGGRKVERALADDLFSLYDKHDKYQHEFALSQKHRYETSNPN